RQNQESRGSRNRSPHKHRRRERGSIIAKTGTRLATQATLNRAAARLEEKKRRQCRWQLRIPWIRQPRAGARRHRSGLQPVPGVPPIVVIGWTGKAITALR